MQIPDVVQAKARQAGAEQWLAYLPDLVFELCARWQLTVGREFPDPTEAYVVAATRVDGTPAVLKLLVPRDDRAAADEILVLREAAGEGCVALYESDAALGAMLLERLGPSLREHGLPIEQRHEILCDVAQALWRPAAHLPLMTGAEKAQWLIEHIRQWWEELDRPCSEQAVDHAIACAERRAAAHDDERARLVHGDVHEWNTLRAGEGWKLVDPDGLRAEPEYDLGIVMREDAEQIRAEGDGPRARWLARRTGCDETAIREWGAAERVSTGLLGSTIGLQPFASQMLAAAERVAADSRG